MLEKILDQNIKESSYMKTVKRVITRRDFIRTSSYLTMGSLMGLPLLGHAAGNHTHKSRVVLIRDDKVIDASGSLRPDHLANMLDQAVATLMKTSDAASASVRSTLSVSKATPGDRFPRRRPLSKSFRNAWKRSGSAEKIFPLMIVGCEKILFLKNQQS